MRCEVLHGEDSKIMLVAYGTVSRICRKAVKVLREQGKKVGLVRPVTLWPFPEKELKKLAVDVDAFLTVEMSCGQMIEDVKLGIECKKPVHLYGRSGGAVPTEDEIRKEVQKIL